MSGGIEKKRVLILSGIKWDDTWQRHQTIAMALFDLGYKVYFIERIISSSFSVKKFWNYLNNLDNSTTSKNIVPPEITVINGHFLNPDGGIFRIINRNGINKILREIGYVFDVVINYLPVSTTFDFINKIKYKILIYDCVRSFKNWGGYPKNFIKIEKWLCDKARYILTDSFYLTNKMKEDYEDKVVQILPTIDASLCKYRVVMSSKKIKNIGYIGTVGEHVDTDLLSRLNKDGFFIHIFGKVRVKVNFEFEYHGFFSDMAKLFQELIESVDALIIPYKSNMDGVIPAKTMQCLSTNLPVFASAFYDMKYLEKFLYIYNNYEELLEKLLTFDSDIFFSKLSKINNFVEMNTVESLKNTLGALVNEV